jgi:secreted trypsin-like serine protease
MFVHVRAAGAAANDGVSVAVVGTSNTSSAPEPFNAALAKRASKAQLGTGSAASLCGQFAG